jgi:SAM-dependent methyltransferase
MGGTDMSAPTSAPFDAVAADYDAAFSRTQIGRLQRERTWFFLKKHLNKSQKILELNGGTGEDAVWLAQQGHQVLCTDISANMVAVAAAKIEKNGLQRLAAARCVDIRDIAEGRAFHADSEEARFDLVFSNFGGLNCLSPAELDALSAALPLQKGGLFAAVVMGRGCIWERLYFLLKGRPKTAFRRTSKGAVPAPLGAGTCIDTWYYTPGAFCGHFPQYNVVALYPVGLFLPPSYLEPFFTQKPRFLSVLYALERRFARARWAADSADHYLVVLEKSS